jgi:hypothetical protein
LEISTLILIVIIIIAIVIVGDIVTTHRRRRCFDNLCCVSSGLSYRSNLSGLLMLVLGDAVYVIWIFALHRLKILRDD